MSILDLERLKFMGFQPENPRPDRFRVWLNWVLISNSLLQLGICSSIKV